MSDMRISSKFVEEFIIQIAYIVPEIGQICTMFRHGLGRIARPSPKKIVVLPWASWISAMGCGGKEFFFGKWGKRPSKELGIAACFGKPMAFLPSPIEN
jgi:hypothetical protein